MLRRYSSVSLLRTSNPSREVKPKVLHPKYTSITSLYNTFEILKIWQVNAGEYEITLEAKVYSETVC